MVTSRHRELAIVKDAESAVNAFGDKLLDRADLWWWTFPAADTEALALRDYIVSTPDAVRRNLRQAAVALSLYRQMRTAQSADMVANVRKVGTPFGDFRERMLERLDEMNAHQLAFFTSLGAAADALSGLAIGVAGIPLPVIRADLGTLFSRPLGAEWSETRQLRKALNAEEESGLGRMQQSAINGLRVALRDAGPPGWLDWLLDQRNTLVHRAPRTVFTNTVWERKQPRFSELPPRRPEQSDIEALRRTGEGVPDFYLTEDLLVTASGLLRSIADGVIAGTAVLTSAWDWRERHRPTVDWRSQWQRDGGADPGFDGYEPGTSVLDPKGGQLHLNPLLVRRFQNAEILDERRGA